VEVWSYVGLAAVLSVSLFFSAASFALKVFSRIKLEELLTKRGKGSDYLDELGRDLHKLMLTCGVIRMSANVVLVLSVAYYFSDGQMRPAQLVEALVVSIVLLSVFSVAFPYAWAKYAPEPFLTRTLPLLRAIKILLKPLLIFMSAIDVLVRRLLGVSLELANNHSAEQDILEAVHEGEEEGAVDPEERKMIEAVIERRSTTVGQIMTPRTEIVALGADASIEAIKENIKEHGHSRVPVYERNLDNIVGMLYVKDLLQFLDEMPCDFSIHSIMRPCYFVPENKLLRDLFAEFRGKKLHVAIVLDEYGGTLGLITFEDLIEEIVGEIADEYESPEPPLIKKLDANTLEIDGRMRVDDLNEEYSIHLPESEDYETIGGFLFSSLGRIPGSGETFQYDDLLFTVVEVTERKIGQIRLELLARHADQRKGCASRQA